MKKYFKIAQMSLEEELIYWANFLFFFVRQGLWFLVELLLWFAVFRETPRFAGFTLGGVTKYYLGVYLAGLMVMTRVDYRLADAIREGRLSLYLLRPLFILWAVFFRQWGRKIYRLSYVFVVLMILVMAGKIQLNWSFFCFLIAIVGGGFLVFLYRFFLGCLAFWLINISSVLHLLNQAASFLGGSWLPLAFFPAGLARWLRFTPFYLSWGFPAEVLMGKIPPPLFFAFLANQLGWIILFLYFDYWLWKKGVRSYEAVGI